MSLVLTKCIKQLKRKKCGTKAQHSPFNSIKAFGVKHVLQSKQSPSLKQHVFLLASANSVLPCEFVCAIMAKYVPGDTYCMKNCHRCRFVYFIRYVQRFWQSDNITNVQDAVAKLV